MICDPMVVIQKCSRLSRNRDIIESDSSPLIIRIMTLINNLEEFNFYHVKRENNHEADHQANMGEALEQDVLNIDHTSFICHVP